MGVTVTIALLSVAYDAVLCGQTWKVKPTVLPAPAPAGRPLPVTESSTGTTTLTLLTWWRLVERPVPAPKPSLKVAGALCPRLKLLMTVCQVAPLSLLILTVVC